MKLNVRWIIVGCVLTVPLVWIAAFLMIRQINMKALERWELTLHQSGLATSLDEIALPPAMSVDDQNTWKSWNHTCLSISASNDIRLFHKLGPDFIPATIMDSIHEIDQFPVLPQILEMLDNGEMQLGLASILNDLRKSQIPIDEWHKRQAGLPHTSRTLANYLYMVAIISNEPHKALSRLNSLVKMYAEALNLNDVCTYNALNKIRDKAVLDCIRMKKISITHTIGTATFWPQENDNSLTRLMSAYRAMRIVEFRFPLNRPIHPMRFIPNTTPPWRKQLIRIKDEILAETYWNWATAPAGRIHLTTLFECVENQIAHKTPLKPPDSIGGLQFCEFYGQFSDNHVIFSLVLPPVTESRIARLSGQILIDAQTGKTIPADSSELCKRYGVNALSPQPESTGLLYTINADGGFSIEADKSTCTPTLKFEIEKPIKIVISGKYLAP